MESPFRREQLIPTQRNILMEKRIGAALILITDRSVTHRLNEILSTFSHIILGRQGVPLPSKGVSVITIIFEGTTDEVGALTGQLGRLYGVQVKSAMLKSKHDL